jgi:hypothetical protein
VAAHRCFLTGEIETTKMEFPAGNIITGLATVVAVVIANRLTYSRSSKEKIWDLRREAYGVILSELGAVERICDNADEHINERGYEEYWNSKSRGRDDAEISKHMGIVAGRFSNDYLILSSEFINAYNELTDDMRSDPHNSLPPDEHDTFSNAIRKHHPLLMALARDEMDVKVRWWWPFI